MNVSSILFRDLRRMGGNCPHHEMRTAPPLRFRTHHCLFVNQPSLSSSNYGVGEITYLVFLELGLGEGFDPFQNVGT